MDLKNILPFFKKKVLLVEDDCSVAQIQQKYLEQNGFKVEHYTNPEDVINKYGQNLDFDVLVTDLDMPQMSGIEMIRELNCGHKPIIMISGCDQIDVPQVKEVCDVFYTKHDVLYFLSSKINDLIAEYELKNQENKAA